MEGFSGETTKNLTIWSISKVSTIHTGKSLNLSMCCSQKTAGWMSAPTAVLLLIFFFGFLFTLIPGVAKSWPSVVKHVRLVCFFCY